MTTRDYFCSACRQVHSIPGYRDEAQAETWRDFASAFITFGGLVLALFILVHVAAAWSVP